MSTSGVLIPGSVSLDGFLTTQHPLGNESIDDIIHPYWKQWDLENMIPDSWFYLVAAWMTFFGILGVLGNLLVIYVFLGTKALRSPSNMLIVNLAVSDMSFSAINGFPLLTIAAINKKWVWGKFWCEIYGFVGGHFGFISINTLCWVAMDRHSVITNPLGGARLSHRKALIMIIITWIWSSMWSLPPFFGYGAYIPEGFQVSCTFDYLSHDIANIIYVGCMYLFAFITPVMIIFWCYIGIVQAVFAHNREMAATAARMGAKTAPSDREKRQEIQIAKVSALTIGTFLLSWLPYAGVGLIGMTSPYSAMAIHPLLSEIPVMFAKASAAYNPVIYALSHPKFRAEIDKRLPWLLACCRPKPQPVQTKSSVTSGKPSKTECETEVSQAPQSVEMTKQTTAANPSA